MTNSSKNGSGLNGGDAKSARPVTGRLYTGLLNPRLLLALGACLLGVAILAANEAIVRQEIKDSAKSAGRHNEMLARSLRDQLGAELASLASLTRYIAEEAHRNGLQGAAGGMARMIAARAGKSADFFLFDAQGGMVWSSREVKFRPEIIADYLAARQVDAPFLRLGAVPAGAAHAAWFIHLVHPVAARDGGVSGLVLAVIDVALLQRSYGERRPGKDGVLALLGADGAPLVGVSGGNIVAGNELAGEAWIRPRQRMARGCRTEFMDSPAGGSSRISSFCGMEVPPLLVAVSEDAGEAMAGSRITVQRYRTITLLLIGLLAGGTLLMLALLMRQQATQGALRNSEARFKALNALGSDWYWEADAEYRLTQVSAGFTRISGRAGDELLGKKRWEAGFITPAGTDWSGHKAVIARNAPFRELVLRYVGPQGVVAYASISGEPVFREDGSLAGYRGVGKDVTSEFVLRQRLRMQHDITRILSREQQGREALRAVIETICRTMEWTWGAHRHLDPETLLLTCHEYWLAPEAGTAAGVFAEFAQQPKAGDPENGVVSRAIVRGETLWFTDHMALNLRRSRLAREAGLMGVVAVPVRRNSGIADALEFFSTRIEAPDQVTLDTLGAIASEVGQFMDRIEAQQVSTHLERERRHLLERLELQLGHMPVACVLEDRNFRVVYCNPAAEQVFGYTSGELRGRDMVELVVPEALRKQAGLRRARLRAGDRHVVNTGENIRKDGGRILCDWSNTPLTDESGEFTGVLATAQDVTERMSMVAALEESEERYRQIFAATPLPMWVTEARTPKFLAVNDAAIAKYGYTREEFGEMTSIDLQIEENRGQVLEQLQERDPTLTTRYERRHVTRDGRQISVEVTAQPFLFGGQQARLIVAIDITDRRRAQQALEDSEARFRVLFEQASVGIAVRELSGRPRFLRVNRKLCEILGYSEAELLRMTTIDLTPDEDMASTHEMNRQLMAGIVTGYSRRKRYRRKDGRIIWVNLSVSRFVEGGAGEKVPYLISVIADITEQVESEERVLESEARYRQIFALTPLPMYLRDERALKFIDINDACLAMYGYTREEMLSLSLGDIQAPANREHYRDELSRSTGIVERLQKQHARRNGEIFDVEIYSYPMTLSGRKVRLVLVRDMAEQLSMERQLRDNESRLRAIVDNVPAVIAFFDDSRQLQYSNLAFDQWFGPARLDVRGGMMRVEQDVSQYGEILMPLLAQALCGEEITAERSLDTRAGVRVARLTLIPHVADDGSVAGVHLMGYDLTDFRKAEAEVRQLNAELEQRVVQRTQALAAANRELEAFSYSVSHDLRAPLRTIDGFSRILLENHAAMLDDTGRGHLERVRAASQRMTVLIDDLLELARVTRRELHIRNCDLTGLSREIAAELQAVEPGRRTKIRVAQGMTVAADAGLLRIAMDNLLRNAWKFTSRKSCAVIEVGCLAAADSRTYFVRDNGVGFDMAHAGKLFGAFQRLHNEAEFQGTGIGLALVQRVIRCHGGRIWAEAEPDRGATFFFSVPDQERLNGEPGQDSPLRAET